jgi:hypothetical protein
MRRCLLLLLFPLAAFASPHPSHQVERIAQILAYPDFPSKSDILAICRVESSFNPKAYNSEYDPKRPNRKVSPSIGIMQVQNGPWPVWKNMAYGVAKLRYDYVTLHSKQAAVHAYNVGNLGYRKGVRNWDYWHKFVKYRKELTALEYGSQAHIPEMP